MSISKILIVEDDQKQIATWQRQIKRSNVQRNTNYNADYAKTLEEASSFVSTTKYDSAIVDIRLESPEGVKDATSDGNTVRDILIKSEILLIAHITGEPGKVNFTDKSYSNLVKVFEKGGNLDEDISVHEEILIWLESKSTIVETMRDVKAKISSKMADLFYKSVWPRWEGWQGTESTNNNFISDSIARHMTSHLYSNFLAGSEGKVHPEEWYFLPPSKKRFHTGDISLFGEQYHILITPRCDLERVEKGYSLLFAEMNLADQWPHDKKKCDERVESLKSQKKNAQPERQKSLDKKISQEFSSLRKNYYGHRNGNFSLHFLPEIKLSDGSTHGPFFVNFSKIISVISGSDREMSMIQNKIAALSPEFVPALVQRMGTYISRIGSPDYSHL